MPRVKGVCYMCGEQAMGPDVTLCWWCAEIEIEDPAPKFHSCPVCNEPVTLERELCWYCDDEFDDA